MGEAQNAQSNERFVEIEIERERRGAVREHHAIQNEKVMKARQRMSCE